MDIFFNYRVDIVQAREFANELRASTKASRSSTVWLEGSSGSNSGTNADTSTVSEAYGRMLTIFIPLLVDEVCHLKKCFKMLFMFYIVSVISTNSHLNRLCCLLQSSFFASFMCFEVLPLVPPGAPSSTGMEGSNDDENDDDLGLMDLDGNDIKPSILHFLNVK